MLKNKMELLQDMKNERQRYTDMLAAWENVTIVTKKDGKPFKSLGKNFTNAHIENCFGLRPNPCLKVVFHTVSTEMSPNGYGYNMIECTEQVNNISKWEGDKSRLIKESLIVPYYYLTVSEIQEKIAERKEWIRNKIIQLDKDIQDFNELCDSLDPLLNDINSIIKNEKYRHDGVYNSDMYYALKNYVKSRLEWM